MAEKAVPRATLFALRETIARLEGEKLPEQVSAPRKADPGGFRQEGQGDGPQGSKRLCLGVPTLDGIMEGGLPLEGLTEIRNGETRNAGAATGFALALAALCQAGDRQAADMQVGDREKGALRPVLWIGQAMAANEAGLPYGVGLQAYGIDIRRFLLCNPRTVQDALWIAEAALAVSVFAVVILEVRGNPACFGLSESRRLHVRARAGKIPLLLLRQAGAEEASSAFFRLHVAPAPARERPLPDGSMLCGSIGNPVFHVTAEKSRALSPAGIFMEWNANDRRFHQLDTSPVAAAAEPASAHPGAHLPASAGRSDGADQMGGVMAFKRAS